MAREQPCSRAVTHGRLQRARACMEAANLVEGLVAGDDQAEADLGASLVTLWGHAGIAASDVICCVRLGRHHTGQDHRGAQALLRAAPRSPAEVVHRAP